MEGQVVVVTKSNRRQKPGPGERCLHGIQTDLEPSRSISKMALTRLARSSAVGITELPFGGACRFPRTRVHRVRSSAAAATLGSMSLRRGVSVEACAADPSCASRSMRASLVSRDVSHCSRVMRSSALAGVDERRRRRRLVERQRRGPDDLVRPDGMPLHGSCPAIQRLDEQGVAVRANQPSQWRQRRLGDVVVEIPARRVSTGTSSTIAAALAVPSNLPVECIANDSMLIAARRDRFCQGQKRVHPAATALEGGVRDSTPSCS